MADTFEMEFEAQVEALAIVDAMQRERDSILSARRANTAEGIAALRKQNASKKQLLKSDLKKSNAFVKKLRSINSEGIQQCARDTETLNLTLFISEIVNAVVATTYKAVDASNMVRLCICIHQKYEEFCTPLVSGLKQALLSPPEDDPDAGKRKRIQIRFLVELFQAGLFDDERFFLQLLKSLLGRDRRLALMRLSSLGSPVHSALTCQLIYMSPIPRSSSPPTAAAARNPWKGSPGKSLWICRGWAHSSSTAVRR
jgi:hypothetical protein